MRPIGNHLRLGICLAVALCAAAGPAAADEVFAPIAAEILGGLRASSISHIPADSGYGRPLIRVRAFRKNDVPVPADIANSWNQRLLHELQRQGRSQFEFEDGAAIGSLVRDITRSDETQAQKRARIADLTASSRADIVISGTVTMAGSTPMLAYQALSADSGRLLASSAPRRMVFPETEAPVLAETPAPLGTAPAAVPPPLPPAGPLGFHPTVLEAQRLLRSLGYDPGPVNGILTWQTRRALRQYQMDSALPVNGRMTRRVVENMRRDTR